MLETKTHLEETTVKALQELISTNLDSADTLSEAASSVDDELMSGMFQRISRERSAHAQELQSYVRTNHEEPKQDGSAGGSVRSTWLKLRAAINGGEPKVVLIEAERAEDVIKSKYEDLIKKTAGSAMNDVLLKQYTEVKQHHDLVRDLRDAQ